MIRRLSILAALPLLASPAGGQKAPSPSAIVAEAPAGEWVAIAPDDLLVMDLAPDRDGEARRVVIQLIPPPFSQGWVDNIRTLARAHWWDGTSVNRVQDNYVAQWGDATEKKPLPAGLRVMGEEAYVHARTPEISAVLQRKNAQQQTSLEEAFRTQGGERKLAALREATRGGFFADSYADETIHLEGWPLAVSRLRDYNATWAIHCYATVGVGRNLSPDTGSGAELYTVIGHAPRHLDRNIAVVGRVVEGIEHLSSLPRGKGDLGFYTDPAKRVPIRSIRLASDLPAGERPSFEYMNTEGPTFARYAEARANRRDPFFIVPAGGADICNIPVPVRRVAG